MKKNNDILDKALDTLFEEASKTILESDGMDTEVEKVEFSSEHNENMDKLFRDMRRKERLSALPKKAMRVAGIVVLVVALISGTIYSVEAWRNKFFNFILDLNSPDSAIEFKDSKQEELYKERVDLDYIPEGFELVENTVSRWTIFLEFRGNTGYFQLKANQFNANSRINTEDVNAENIDINNYPGVFMENENENTLIWHDSKYVFRIMSNLKKQEMVKIAQNIKSK